MYYYIRLYFLIQQQIFSYLESNALLLASDVLHLQEAALQWDGLHYKILLTATGITSQTGSWVFICNIHSIAICTHLLFMTHLLL